MTSIDDNVALEAISLVAGDRQHDYGHYSINMRNIATAWIGVTGNYHSAADVARMLAAMKIVRAAHRYKRDNYVDAIAYLLIAESLDNPDGTQTQ